MGKPLYYKLEYRHSLQTIHIYFLGMLEGTEILKKSTRYVQYTLLFITT